MEITSLGQALNKLAKSFSPSPEEQIEHMQIGKQIESEARRLIDIGELLLVPMASAAASQGQMSLTVAALQTSIERAVIEVPAYFNGQDSDFSEKVLGRVMDILSIKCEALGLKTEPDRLSDGSRVLRAVWDDAKLAAGAAQNQDMTVEPSKN